jgi:hypothetical protein
MLMRPEGGVYHSPSSIAEVERRVELYLCSSSGSSWPVLGWTLLTLYIHWMLLGKHSFVFSNDYDDVGVQKENNNYNNNRKYRALFNLWRIKKSWCDRHCRLADISSCCIHIYFGRKIPLKPARKPGTLRKYFCGRSWTNHISFSLRH